MPLKDKPNGRKHRNGSMLGSPEEVGPDAELLSKSPSVYSAANITVVSGRDEKSHSLEAPSTNRKTYKRQGYGGRWSNREKKNLSEYFQTQEGLSLQQKSDGYRRCYGSHCPLQSITKEAVRMGLDSTGNQKNRKIVKLKTSLNLNSTSSRTVAQGPIPSPNASPEHEGL
ncbi:hypothetical protein PENSTE_c023G00735 [Penicillium steckii]|uniref:Uncharacterized protein n=1 Tax=Penicillium steckii TaxID=303698 RepID=A0A1V6SRM4_9EURO|nr:hypothetical protein PENSTE_c023G00735 [Penicillium steckii]